MDRKIRAPRRRLSASIAPSARALAADVTETPLVRLARDLH